MDLWVYVVGIVVVLIIIAKKRKRPDYKKNHGKEKVDGMGKLYDAHRKMF